jgi:hypothetical protein
VSPREHHCPGLTIDRWVRHVSTAPANPVKSVVTLVAQATSVTLEGTIVENRVSEYWSTLSSSDCGEPVGAYARRQAEFGVRYEF